MDAQPDAFDDTTLTYLRAVSQHFPNADTVLAEIARLSSALTFPKGIVHVVSDVHGEFKKLRHIVNNASGSLRPLVVRIVAGRLTEAQTMELLTLIYYPREAWAHTAPSRTDQNSERAFLHRIARFELEILRALAATRPSQVVDDALDGPFRDVLRELTFAPEQGRPDSYVDVLLEPFVRANRSLDLLRLLAHAIRNLAVAEIIVAGDLPDRGPRVDKVIEFLMRQPKVSFTWGNHDVSWIGACLGQEALIATVLRISLRYRRLSQLEEGYGIIMSPVEKLARTVYADDPAERFPCKGEGLRDPLLMARMQKAMAVIQFKLEGQVIQRNPAYQMEHRALLHRIDRENGTVLIDGTTYPMLDTHLPTVDPASPYTLSPDEVTCMARLKRSFLESAILWRHIEFVVKHGKMASSRDDTLIFHGCVPVDEAGQLLPMPVMGEPLAGRALFEALEAGVHRAVTGKAQEDLDRLWYLWTGAVSPCFGKDKMTTFEGYFVADKAAQKETKNAYFNWIHDAPFCDRILAEFGVDTARGLIVNGHVPVHVEKGESPLKRSGKAITIDGAFSEAYGDRGYTLVLDPARTYLAEHHHFESVEDVIARGADILPKVVDVRTEASSRTIGDTEQGRAIRLQIALLEQLGEAYQRSLLVERP